MISDSASRTAAGSISLGDIDPGEHTLQVNGTSRQGAVLSANLGVIVNPPQSPEPDRGALPATGTVATPIWLVALVVLGVGLVATSGRRRSDRN